MGLDGMRVGGGRCPPLFVSGLLLACLLLICTWWSLSTENLDLIRQIDELNEQLKISAEERDQCVTLRENVEQRYKRLEDEVGNLHVRVQQLDDVKKKNDQLSESVTLCKSELDSLTTVDATKSATLDALRLDMETITTQLDAKKDENQKLKDDLQTALNEIDKLKLSINIPKEKDDTADDVPLQATSGLIRGVKSGQLAPVAESAVSVSVSGDRGIKYHGIPILPRDPPGIARQRPRFSVTLLEVPTAEPNKVENSADADAKEEEENPAEANASGVENRFNAPPDESFDNKAAGEQP